MTNDAQRAAWNDVSGPHWVNHERVYDRMLEPFQAAVLRALDARPGESVLDIGCGFGTTSLAVAEAVDGGRVHGVDISEPMIRRARERAALAGARATFTVGDAQVDPLGEGFDAVVSRFGTMFFEDPVAAFANIGSALRPGGRLAAVCWRAPTLNPFFGAVARHLIPLLPEPPAPTPPNAPGPFGLQDGDRTTQLLLDAGWGGVVLEPFDTYLRFDMDGDDGIESALDQALASDVGRRAAAHAAPGDLADAVEAARSDLRTRVVDGVVQFPGAVWIVTAHRPG